MPRIISCDTFDSYLFFCAALLLATLFFFFSSIPRFLGSGKPSLLCRHKYLALFPMSHLNHVKLSDQVADHVHIFPCKIRSAKPVRNSTVLVNV